MPILLFAVVFGLSTDYGVFLFQRIGEARRRTETEDAAIADGLVSSGRVITAAAMLFAVAMGAFVFSDLIYVKEVAVGAAVAVLVDATIVQGLPPSRHSRACSASRRGGRRVAWPPGAGRAQLTGMPTRVDGVEECIDHRGENCVPARAGAPRAPIRADRRAVHAVADHRFVGVPDGEDGGLNRNLVLRRGPGVTGAVGPLVMGENPARARRPARCSRASGLRAPDGASSAPSRPVVSGPGLHRMESGTPILPMSWRIPASRTRSHPSSSNPSSRAIISQRRPTVWLCLAVPESR